jgi:hypothetical protein
MISSNDEETHLLADETGKGRCWCCWETDETTSNPLVRVCKGCKDVDLQWIHQDCIDRYISLLPPPRSGLLIGSDQDFACTRCNDPYNVESRSTHPLIALKSEPFLFPAMIVITICMIVLTVSCVSLIIDNLYSDLVFFLVYLFGLLVCLCYSFAIWLIQPLGFLFLTIALVAGHDM